MKKFFLVLIEVYHSVKFLFPGHCKFTPSCSEYARQALVKYPLRRALKLTFLRILRCHPFSPGRVDFPS